MSSKRITGPIQVFIIGFEKFHETGKIVAELKRARKRGVIRLVDLLFVQKDKQGNISNSMHMTDMSEFERRRLGAVAGGLIGLGTGRPGWAAEGAAAGAQAATERDFGLSADRLSELADSIPKGTSAAIVVIEHHWATRLRDAIAEGGGMPLAQAMISPTALMMVGRELEAIMEAQEMVEAAEVVKLAAAMEIAQVLVETEMIEEAAISEAADVVAAALAVEDAAIEEAVSALVAAEMIEESAKDRAAKALESAIATENGRH